MSPATSPAMIDELGVGTTGIAVARNIRHLREGRHLTYVALTDLLAIHGRAIAVLGLRRIERGERRVDVDDLVAFAAVFEVPVVELLTSGTVAGWEWAAP